MDINKLVNAAIKGRENAFTPYSHFKVGAAVLLENGTILDGCNIENASYGLCNCAERTALFKAYSMGYKKEDIKALAVVADTDRPTSPCGACRQVMSELMNQETPVYMANLKGDVMILSVKELLPYSFSESDLK
jgi:cytidine deaminase